MRVLMTADTVGGVWTYAMELATAIRGLGVEITLATRGRRPTPAQHADAEAAGVDLHESELRLEWMHDPWPDVQRAHEWLLDLAATVRPDLVHLNDYAHGGLPFGVPVLVVAHSCVLSWYAAVKRDPSPAGWDRYRREVTNGLRAATEVAAPSAAMLASLEEHYGPLAHARVIPNARRAELFRPAARKEPFVLAAGRLWDEAKNVAILDAVAARLPWRVRLAGEDAAPKHAIAGGPTSAPRSLAGHSSSARACAAERLGPLAPEELARWMGRASIFALPARYEPFGLSALEAALAGCALVLGDIPSLREIWQDAALFVHPDDEEALVAAIRSLASDDAMRRRFAALAQARARRFTPEAFAAAYRNCYEELLARRAAERWRRPCAW